MFGLGAAEILILLAIGLLVVVLPVGIIVLVLHLVRTQVGDRIATLEAEVRRLREQLETRRNG